MSGLNSSNVSSASDTSCEEVGIGFQRQHAVSMRYAFDPPLLQYQANEQQPQSFPSPTPLRTGSWCRVFSTFFVILPVYFQSFVFLSIKHPVKGGMSNDHGLHMMKRPRNGHWFIYPRQQELCSSAGTWPFAIQGLTSRLLLLLEALKDPDSRKYSYFCPKIRILSCLSLTCFLWVA